MRMMTNLFRFNIESEVKEYNKIFYPRYKNAKSVIVNMEHAIEKCENPDTVKYQLACIGWNEDTKQFLLDALETLKSSNSKACGK